MDDSVSPQLVSIYPHQHGDIKLSLWVAEMSSSDLPKPTSGQSRVDTLVAIPLMLWGPAGEPGQMQEAMSLLARKAISGIEIKSGCMPIVMRPGARITFSIENNTLQIKKDGGGTAGIFQSASFPVDLRMAWFLRLCRSLTLGVIYNEQVWVTTALLEGETVPQACVHKGALKQKNFPMLVEKSRSWQAYIPGNMSITADGWEADDDHYDTYRALEDGAQLPAKLDQSRNASHAQALQTVMSTALPIGLQAIKVSRPSRPRFFASPAITILARHLRFPCHRSFAKGTSPRISKATYLPNGP